MNKDIMRLFNYCYLVGLLITSCGDCEDLKLGVLSPPEYLKDYIIHDDEDLVSYEDEMGNTRVFTVAKTEFVDRVNGEVIGTQGTQEGTVECFEYNNVTLPHLRYSFNDEDANNNARLSIRILAIEQSNIQDPEIDTAMEINYGSSSEGNYGGAQGFYHITEERNLLKSELPRFAKLNEWEAHGKIYENVLHYSTDDGGFYFSVGSGFVGLVGFDGVLWTLKE